MSLTQGLFDLLAACKIESIALEFKLCRTLVRHASCHFCQQIFTHGEVQVARHGLPLAAKNLRNPLNRQSNWDGSPFSLQVTGNRDQAAVFGRVGATGR